jgi:hypothetical protein
MRQPLTGNDWRPNFKAGRQRTSVSEVGLAKDFFDIGLPQCLIFKTDKAYLGASVVYARFGRLHANSIFI